MTKEMTEEKTYEEWVAIVKEDSFALELVPERLRDRPLCSLAVIGHGCALEYVPEQLKDREICLNAVKELGLAIEYIPEELLDREICTEALRHYYDDVIELVPEIFVKKG